MGWYVDGIGVMQVPYFVAMGTLLSWVSFTSGVILMLEVVYWYP